jgi:hypothetical protein
MLYWYLVLNRVSKTPTEYIVRPDAIKFHYCAKGGVDFLRLGEDMFCKPKHNDKKRSTKNHNEM